MKLHDHKITPIGVRRQKILAATVVVRRCPPPPVYLLIVELSRPTAIVNRKKYNLDDDA